jgi:protein gp37
MGDKTAIQWTDSTWNPVRGCSMAKGSEAGGCLNCYAARYAVRGLQRDSAGEPFAVMRESGPRWTGKVELVEKMLFRPLKWTKPRRIFVNSQSDLFHEGLADEAIDRVFATMALCPQHTFQVLTKRPERMLAFMSRENIVRGPGIRGGWNLPNVWLGVSVEDEPTADARIPLLLKTPAAKRFVSYEPALRRIDFEPWLEPFDWGDSGDLRRLDWIIVGGESGPGARPFDIAWARNVIAQCKAAGVACFVKQLGAMAIDPLSKCAIECGCGLHYGFHDKKGGNWAEWPEDLRVREFPA